MNTKSRFFLLLIFVFGASELYADSAGDVFLIESIPLDISAESASMAREQAIATARQKAWNFFINRVLPEKYLSSIGSISDQELIYFVESFSLNSEKNSPTRYIGDFKIGFHKKRVHEFFQKKGLPYIKVKGPKLLVIPIFKMGEKIILWDEQNQWLQAWKNLKHPNGLISIIVPLGDLEDEQLLDFNKALTGNQKALLSLARKYQVDDVIVTVAEDTKDQPNALKIKTQMYYLSQEPEKINASVDGDQLSKNQDLWTYSAHRLVKEIENKWREKYLGDPHRPKETIVSIKINSPQDVDPIIKDLKRLSALQNIEIRAISCVAVDLVLSHFMESTCLKTLLNRNGFKIEEVGNGLILTHE